MLTPLAAHPATICREIVGRPQTVDEAKRYFNPLDYAANQDWIVRSKVYQRKVSGPIYYEDALWYSMSDITERDQIESIMSCTDEDGNMLGGSDETKVEYTVQYMHEHFGWEEHIFSDLLVRRWHDIYANISLEFDRTRRPHEERNQHITLHQPSHRHQPAVYIDNIFFESVQQRFNFYATLLYSLGEE